MANVLVTQCTAGWRLIDHHIARLLALALASLAYLSGTAYSTNLFIADYSGFVTTAALTSTCGGYSLEKTFTTNQCAPNPSWLTADLDRGLLYCLNEGLNTVNGSLSSFTVNTDGSLKLVQDTKSINGPVSGALYGSASGPRGIALAHYGGSAVSTWVLKNNGAFTLNQHFDYTLSHPGAVPDRQDAPHEHEAIVDPTGQYILVPDLGADLIRVFSYDQKTLKLKTLDPLKVKPGTGPRHAAFWQPTSSGKTYFYLVAELAATVTGYSVEYLSNGKGLNFTQIYSSPTYGDKLKQPPGNAPAEITVSPDNRFIVISNRNDTYFTLPNGKKSDSISTFQFQNDGKLSFVQLAPAGGSFPRHFSINKACDLIVIGLQNDNNVVVMQRAIDTGLIGNTVASLGVSGNPTCVIFDEK
ncbi:putative isomerase YbhE [Acrodontium crateriforme]|uniref:Isomerase YbhE n=1 Tax=Acrodontium crateriforme TaxID=150365 RepID=A0AAQ3M682_9PEZI|nr:putative isomerase YbhE [Acrodontium crateriforme]